MAVYVKTLRKNEWYSHQQLCFSSPLKLQEFKNHGIIQLGIFNYLPDSFSCETSPSTAADVERITRH